jgi:hypothetical protein
VDPETIALVAIEDQSAVSPLERPQSIGIYSRPEAMAELVEAQLYAHETWEFEETKPERADASLYANPRFFDEETAVVATGAADVVLVVVGFGVVETLVERVVGTTTGAIEVVGITIGVVEAFWLCVAGVCWMKTAALEEAEETEVAEEVVAGASLTTELVGVATGVEVDDSVNKTGVPLMVEVPSATGDPVS